MSITARQSTARTIMVGPVLDSAGAAVTGAVVGDFKISKNGAAPAALNASATLTHRHTGHYSLALTASDTDTVGSAQITLDKTTDSCPEKDITVVEEAVYDLFWVASATGLVSLANAAMGGSSLTLTLKQLVINNSAGVAVDIDASGGNAIDVAANTGNASAMRLAGSGAGSAWSMIAGATGNAVNAVGGATSGAGLNIATTDGHGITIAAAGAGRVDISADVTGAFVGDITGNLSGSVGSVTGAVGSVTGNVGGNVAGSVGSVTGAVGSVTGNVGGNVAGSVGSVTGNVGGNVTGSIGSLAAQAKLDVNTEADTALSDYGALKPTTAGRTLDVSATGEAGLDWANVGGQGTAVNLSSTTTNLVNTVTTYTGNTPQTGDSFARLGAPAGASIAADLVVIDDFVDALESRLTAARAGYLDNINNANLANVPAFPSNFASLGINASGHVSRVVLVDTTTTNTDMRGTDNAALATTLASLVTTVGVAGAGLTAADDAVIAAIAGLNNLSAAQVNAEVLDVLATDTFAEAAGVPAATSSLKDKLNWVFMLHRNKITQTATTQTVRNDADSASVATSAVSDDGTTFVRAEYT